MIDFIKKKMYLLIFIFLAVADFYLFQIVDVKNLLLVNMVSLVLSLLIALTKDEIKNICILLLYSLWIPIFVDLFLNKAIYDYSLFSAEYLISCIIYFVIFFTVYAILHKMRITMILVAAISMIAGLSNYYVTSFRGSAIILDDILSIRTGLNVASNYSFFMNEKIFIFLLCILLLAGFCFLLSNKNESFKSKLTVRIPQLVFSLLMIGILTSTKFIDSFGINHDHFDITNGFVLDLMIQIEKKQTDRVIPGSSVETAKEIAEKYESDSLESLSIKPNIIIIMNESFSDLAKVADIPLNKDNMPFFHSLEENTVKGNVIVSVNGAGTPNSEFEFLLGASMMHFSGYPYNSFSRLDTIHSLNSQLKQYDYASTFIHTYYESGWNRRNVYDALQFDQQLYIGDLGDYNNDEDMVRYFPSDRFHYKKVLEVLENTEETDFIMNVTMQNHGGYDDASLNDLDKQIYVADDPDNNHYLETYLSLVYESDMALEWLITELQDFDEPTVICFYGDHQPGFGEELFTERGVSLEGEGILTMYETPFLIWSNYPIEEKDLGTISLNYLSSYLLESIGFPLTAYNKYLLEMSADYPVVSPFGYVNSIGDYQVVADDSSKIQTYQTLMDNQIRDLPYTVDELFSYKK